MSYDIKIDDNFQSAFDGLMLGDGSVAANRAKRVYVYSQGCKHREWLDDLKLWFLEHGFSSSVCQRNNHPSPFSPAGFVNYQLRVNNKAYFSEQRKRWYTWTDQDGWEYNRIQKVVPGDIVLTPECVANWYMGDGCFGKKQRMIVFATQGLLEADVDFLCDLLEYYVGIETHKYAREVGHVVQITKEVNVETLVEYIRPFIHSVYSYKIGE